MKARKKNCSLEFRQLRITLWILLILLLMMLNITTTFSQNNVSNNFATPVSGSVDTSRTLFGGTITDRGYGGVVLKFSRLDDQFTFMTGGRGAITINNRFTIGGGGYGIANSIVMPDSIQDTSQNFKMGYGGLESGCIFFKGKKVRTGGSLLLAAGAAFWQNKPISEGEELFDDDFNIFRYWNLHCTVKSLLTGLCGFMQESATGMFTKLIWIT